MTRREVHELACNIWRWRYKQSQNWSPRNHVPHPKGKQDYQEAAVLGKTMESLRAIMLVMWT